MQGESRLGIKLSAAAQTGMHEVTHSKHITHLKPNMQVNQQQAHSRSALPALLPHHPLLLSLISDHSILASASSTKPSAALGLPDDLA